MIFGRVKERRREGRKQKTEDSMRTGWTGGGGLRERINLEVVFNSLRTHTQSKTLVSFYFEYVFSPLSFFLSLFFKDSDSFRPRSELNLHFHCFK